MVENVFPATRLARGTPKPPLTFMFDLPSIKKMNERAAEYKAREALRRGKKQAVVKPVATQAKVCSCPSVACDIHGLPPGSASGGW
jgi:hypothetical protein